MQYICEADLQDNICIIKELAAQTSTLCPHSCPLSNNRPHTIFVSACSSLKTCNAATELIKTLHLRLPINTSAWTLQSLSRWKGISTA